jgi:hypothetical protein
LLRSSILDSGFLGTENIARGSNNSRRTVGRWRAHERPVARDSEERLLEIKTVVDLGCLPSTRGSAALDPKAES